MHKQERNWAWQEIPYDKWKCTADRRLAEKYAITLDDAGVDDECLNSCWKSKQSPYEFVEWFGMKYDLTPR